MDRFAKFVLALIAAALAAIAVKMWTPGAQATSFLSGAPTIGDFQDAKTTEDRRQLVRRIPLVRVQGGSVSVD